MRSSSTFVVVADILGDLAVAVIKLVVAWFSGSSAMLAEGIHTLVDTSNGLLLWLGITLARRPPDDTHPFGHGLEVYFWGLVVAILIFGAGGGMSIYEGVERLLHHAPDSGDPTWSYVVLAVSLVFEAVTSVIAYREFARQQRGRTIWETIHGSKDPTTFIVLLENVAAVLGVAIAFLGIFLGKVLDIPALDPVASILVGVLLAAVAIVLVRETRSLMLGEGASPKVIDDIRARLEADPAVVNARRPLTLFLGPRRMLVVADVQFDPRLTANEVEASIARMEADIRDRYPKVSHLFLEAAAVSRSSTARA
jgi:cation diffusion facilitator family transporter